VRESNPVIVKIIKIPIKIIELENMVQSILGGSENTSFPRIKSLILLLLKVACGREVPTTFSQIIHFIWHLPHTTNITPKEKNEDSYVPWS